MDMQCLGTLFGTLLVLAFFGFLAWRLKQSFESEQNDDDDQDGYGGGLSDHRQHRR